MSAQRLALKRLFCTLALVVVSSTALAQHDTAGLEAANNNIANIPSLQRGAKYFVNFCMGCHSAQYVRYNRLAEDLQITEDQLVRNLMFTGERPFDTMEIAMPPEDAARWFGIPPPDLSLIARSRGTDYIYSFLRGFYADPTSPTGADNIVLPNTAMPHVLWELQGIQEAHFVEEPGAAAPHFEGFELVEPGALSPQEFEQATRDIVNFLEYIAEPVQRQRQALGVRVIAFLLVFLLIAYLLKKEIWKGVS